MWSSAADEILDAIQNESEEEHPPPAKMGKQRKQSWTEKNMAEAINCCKNQELGIEEASLIYGIPKRSLRSRLKDKNFSVIDVKYRVFLLPVFPLQAELELAEYLSTLVQAQFTFTANEVRRLAYELVSEKYMLNNLPREKDCLLGNRWYRTFVDKYPSLDADATGQSSERFYDALEGLIADNELDATRIFSVDGVELKFRASNAQDFDTIYHRRKIIYTDAKAICCMSAAGAFIPPVFIDHEKKEANGGDATEHPSGTGDLGWACEKLRDWCEGDSRLLPTAEEVAAIRSQIKATLNKKLSEENEEELRERLYEQFNKLRNKIVSRYESSLNAISQEVFYEWFEGFVAFVKPNCQRKVVLLLGDQNHAKHLKTLQLAKSNGVALLAMPPHSLHKIHPLDGFAMSLNRNLSTCACVWLGKNPDFEIREVPLRELFETAYGSTVNHRIAKNGFTYSGIWPVNRNVFESAELGGESLLKSQSLSEVIDVGKLCRVCMKEKMYMKPLFDQHGVNYHGRKISEILDRQVSPEDGLPHRICQYCLVRLMDWVKLRNMAAESKAGHFGVCRVCAEEKRLMSPLLSSDVATKLAEVTRRRVVDDDDDDLPASICAFCRTSVNQAWEFVRKVIASDRRLREIIGET